MSGHHPPLTCDEFKAVLERLGFAKRPQRSGTTHESWVGTTDGKFCKVTVDCPKAPFSQDLITSMAHQAGVSKKRIYEIHFGLAEEAKPRIEAAGRRRFQARKQPPAGLELLVSEYKYWCVWDLQTNTLAFGGSHTYMTEADAMTQTDVLCKKYPV